MKRSKIVKKKKKISPQWIFLFALIVLIFGIIVYKNYSGDLRSRAVTNIDPRSIELGTFYPIIKPSLIPQYNAIPGVPNSLITGGPLPADAPYYCIDDIDPEGCDDQTAFWVPKGSNGISGVCGSVIEQSHKIVNSLPHGFKDFRDSLNPAISNCGYDTGVYSSGYISTFLVIDSYNLAGYHDLSKNNPDHIVGDRLLAWWQSLDAAGKGYTFVPYTPTVLSEHASGSKNLTGCVVFLRVPGGIFPGIFNMLEVVDTNGNGVLSILQSGARYYIDRFEVVGWDVKNTPLHQTVQSGVAGFGCH